MSNSKNRREQELLSQVEELRHRISGLEASARAAESAQRETRDQADAILEAIPDLMFRLSRNGEHLDFYAASRDQLFVDPEEILGKRVDQVLPPEVGQRYLRSIEKTLDSGEMQIFEYRLEFDDGPRYYEGRMVVGGDAEVLTIVRDITRRKLAADERESLQSQLAQAQKMESIGRLAGGVAHDFNNMLGVILGQAEMALQDLQPSDPLFDSLQEILQAAERSAELTSRLLGFARKQEISPKVLDLNKTVSGMITLLRQMVGEDIRFEWRPGSEIWPIRADPSQIHQVLANLCVNARDAIADVGRLTIGTGKTTVDEKESAARSGLQPGDFVLLSVNDDGCGMDKETLARAFEPYFTTKATGAGTGLGLATVYGIVKQNGGFIEVRSEPNQGTTTTIYLPRHEGDADQVRRKEPADWEVHGQGTVLVVEDEQAILTMVTSMLKQKGYEVLATSGPAEALRLAEEHSGAIDLLLTDVVMPEMNGRDLADRLQGRFPDLKCLFMSGYTDDVVSYRGVLDEDVSLLHKPFSVGQLLSAVSNVLSEAERN